MHDLEKYMILLLIIAGFSFALTRKATPEQRVSQGDFVPWYLTYNSPYAAGFTGMGGLNIALPSNDAGLQNAPSYGASGATGGCTACSLFPVINSGQL